LIRNVGLSSGLLLRRSYRRVVEMSARSSHSCTLAMSESCESAFRRRRGAERMDAKAENLLAEAGGKAVRANDVLVDGRRIERPIKALRPLTDRNSGPSGSRRWPAISRYSPMSLCVAGLTGRKRTLSRFRDAEAHDALPAMYVLNSKVAELCAAQALVKERRKNRAVADPFERVAGRRVE
jgi:hypothetical protein